MFKLNPFATQTPTIFGDAYKMSHRGFMEPGTEYIYSNMTGRNFKYLPIPKHLFNGKIVITGIQAFSIKLTRLWKEKFFDLPKEQVARRFKRLVGNYLGPVAADPHHLEELHDLGYLPIRIKALPEGSLVDAKVPFLTIVNTDPRFAWLTNYLETYLSCELWKPITVATIAYEYRRLANRFAMETVGSIAGTEWQIHDFSFRGMSGVEDAASSGAAVLLSTCGTDTSPALEYLENYYGVDAETEFVAGSVPASEHSLASTGIAVRGELETYRKWITQDYPSGIVSVIADTLDFFRVVTEFATELKQDILNRVPNELGLAKVVFRPDSGDPVKIVTGYKTTTVESTNSYDELADAYNDGYEAVKVGNVYYEIDTVRECGELQAVFGKVLSEDEIKGAVECLWEIFGGTETSQGYRLLHERVGLIYGDSITLERADQIFKRLKAKGFASLNVVFGVGSYTFQYLTRDSAGMAVKATAAKVNGQWYALSKDPKTDDGTKKSAKGLLRVEKTDKGNFILFDEQSLNQETQGALKTVLEDGILTKLESFHQIKERLWASTVSV